MLHVFFLGLAEKTRARRYLTHQAELSDQRLAQLRGLADSLDRDSGPLSTHGRLALEYGLRLAGMQRDWATWAATQIDTTPYQLDPAAPVPVDDATTPG